MYRPGDKVYIETSAIIDIGYQAFVYVSSHPYAVVKARMTDDVNVPEKEVLYCLEWPEEFPGGWDCYGHCLPRRGQQITSKHLTLDFEGSREVTTVPNIEYSEHL